MKSLWPWFLGPLAQASHVGIYVEEDTLYGACVAPTLLGPKVRDEQQLKLGSTASSLVGEVLDGMRLVHGPPRSVVVGIPPRDVYLETRRLTPGTAPDSLRTLDVVAPLSAGQTGRPVVQLIRRSDETSGLNMHCVVAVRETVLEKLEDLIPPRELVAVNHEPAALAALRWSLYRHPPAEAGALSVRLLCGPSLCMGYLLLGATPFLWASAPHSPPEERPRQLRALLSGMIHHARSYLEVVPRDVAIEGVDPGVAAEVGRPLDTPLRVLSGPPIDGRAIATGLALGSCGVRPAAIHLHRHSKERRRTVRAKFPWKDVAIGAGAVATMAFSLEIEARRLAAAIEVARRELPARQADAARPITELEAEKQALARFQDQWLDFVDRPLSWSRVLANLAQALPDQLRLARVDGSNPPFPAAPGDAREFVMNVVSPEKHLTLGAVLSDPYLKRAFPRIEVSISVGTDPNAGILYTLIASGRAAVPDQPQEVGSRSAVGSPQTTAGPR